MPMSVPLFEPIRIAGRELANRIVVAPMCQYSAEDGAATDWHMMHCGALSNSGAGLLVFEASAVEERGRITHGDLGIYSDACEDALARVVRACRRYGTAALGIQLAHAGRKGSAHVPWQGGRPLTASEEAWETIAPSPLPFGPDWHSPREMSTSDMAEVKEAFVSAAERALRLDLDMIELHLAHGYLLHEFLSPVSNVRSDEYGGALEGRMRYPLEIAAALRARWPAERMLGARLTGSDWIEGGWSSDDAIVLAKRLKDIGFDFVCVSSAGISPAARIPVRPGYQVEFAAQVRREAKIVTRTAGLISAPEQANAIVANGQADLVALARPFLHNPHWAWDAAQALGAEVRRPPQYQRAAPDVWPALQSKREAAE
jgi:2,4-dienoyl-CoA reductase-like NADH-dependent reductase (Old Yellow Enzyme family)